MPTRGPGGLREPPAPLGRQVAAGLGKHQAPVCSALGKFACYQTPGHCAESATLLQQEQGKTVRRAGGTGRCRASVCSEGRRAAEQARLPSQCAKEGVGAPGQQWAVGRGRGRRCQLRCCRMQDMAWCEDVSPCHGEAHIALLLARTAGSSGCLQTSNAGRLNHQAKQCRCPPGLASLSLPPCPCRCFPK